MYVLFPCVWYMVQDSGEPGACSNRARGTGHTLSKIYRYIHVQTPIVPNIGSEDIKTLSI